MTQSPQITSADSAAARNLRANTAAIRKTQPTLLIDEPPPIGEWLFGRDGYLTARDENQKWITGCSLPRRAADEVLRKLNVAGAVACFLAPVHAAQVRVALDRMAPEQAIIVVLPGRQDLSMILRCDNFSDEISAHRLWFVAGESWETDLGALLREKSGLAIPCQFIRLPSTPQTTIDSMVLAAQRIFSDVIAARAELGRVLRDRWSPGDSGRLCVVASSRFRLWNDAGRAINSILSSTGSPWNRVDLDDPACSSPLAVLEAIHGCDAIFTIDTGRADSPGLLPGELPWITWVTAPRAPSFAGAGKFDQLLVVDPRIAEIARSDGWPADRVHAAGFPDLQRSAINAPTALAIIEDTFAIDAPDDLVEFSSHLVLWESIARNLFDDPLTLGENVQTYLDTQAAKLQIPAASVDRSRFIRKLILPAYAHGIARALIRAGLPIKLFGQGWESIPEFAPHSASAIASHSELQSVLNQPLALVHVWPWRGAHAVDAQGRPVLRPSGGSLESFVKSAQQILTKPPVFTPRSCLPAISSDVIKNAMNRARSDS